jgi:hypothetical protein
MRKSVVLCGLQLLAIIIASGPARAQVQISLGSAPGTTNALTFTNVTGPPHHLDVMLGSCSGTSCSLTSGNTSFLDVNGSNSGGVSSSYTIATTLSGSTAFPTLTATGNPDVADYNLNGSTTTFDIMGIGAIPGEIKLELTITQVTGATTTHPTFHGTYTKLLVTPGSTLDQYFGPVLLSDFNFTVTTGISLTNLFLGANGDTTTGNITDGAIHTPEPASIALFGSGLVLLGGAIRRRLRRKEN